MSRKIFKEGIIIFLLIVVIVFTMGILFYDLITEDVEDIVQTQYANSKVVEEVLKDIDNKGGKEVKPNTSDSLLKSYSITADDLTGFASDNYYESGKKDPFAESSEKIDEHVTTTVQTGTATNSQTSNPIKNTNTITNSNTVTSEKVKKDTNTVKEKNENVIKNTVSTNTVNTNTVKNTIKENKTNTINNISKDKNESSSKGTFFEDKNSK